MGAAGSGYQVLPLHEVRCCVDGSQSWATLCWTRNRLKNAGAGKALRLLLRRARDRALRSRCVRDGGLSSLGPDVGEIWDRAANLIDRILKGAKPADLPLAQSTRFHVSINLKTANSLGITVPASVIVRADEVIE